MIIIRSRGIIKSRRFKMLHLDTHFTFVTVTAAVKPPLPLPGQNCRRALMVSYSSEKKHLLFLNHLNLIGDKKEIARNYLKCSILETANLRGKLNYITISTQARPVILL